MRGFECSNGLRKWHEAGDESAPSTDVRIVTSDGDTIPAHSSVLASASSVLDRMLDKSRRNRNSERSICILGVPSDAVLAFVQLLYSSQMSISWRDREEAIEKHGAVLLVLSHAYRVEWLKKEAEIGMAARLRAERAVDMLKLAKLCDAPRLYLRCMRLAVKEFGAVQQSEGWRFLRRHDPAVELEILQFLEEYDQREKRWRRTKQAQEVYHQLNEAMECLHHICSKGYADVGPTDVRPGGGSTEQSTQRPVPHVRRAAAAYTPLRGMQQQIAGRTCRRRGLPALQADAAALPAALFTLRSARLLQYPVLQPIQVEDANGG